MRDIFATLHVRDVLILGGHRLSTKSSKNVFPPGMYQCIEPVFFFNIPT